MNISSINYLSFLRSSFDQISIGDLSPLQKRIGAIALIALAALAACYLIFFCCCKKRNVAPSDDENPSVNDIAQKTISPAASPTKPKVETAEAQKKSEEVATETPKEAEAKDSKKTDANDTLASQPFAQNPISPSVTPVKPIVVPPVALKPKGISDADLTRILYHGLSKRDQKPISLWKELVPAFEKFKNDRDLQKTAYHNEELGKTLIDTIDFEKKAKLSYTDLQVFLRYLVYEGIIASYHQARSGWAISHTQADIPSAKPEAGGPIFTKDKLIQIDQGMCKAKLTIAADKQKGLTDNQNEFLAKMLTRIEEMHYSLACEQRSQAHDTLLNHEYYKGTAKVMDLLVLEGVIASWNCFSNTYRIYIKFQNSDPIMESGHLNFDVWRDRDIIEEELAFKHANQVSLPSQILNGLDHKKSERLKEIVEKLNARVAPGPSEVSNEYGNKQLIELLLTHGCISSFRQKNPSSWNSAWLIFAKPTDGN